jgi:Ser/Thr protein kinase RdoA (MazF antagonist)
VSASGDISDPAADLLRAVADAYRLRAPFSVEPLAGGYANDVFLLTSDRPVVLHMKHPPVDLQSLSWEHHLLDLLRPHLPEIPEPLRALDGRTFLLHEKRPVWLTPTSQVCQRDRPIGVQSQRPSAGCMLSSSI